MTICEFDYEKEPVVSVVKKILTDAVKMKASDIHFDPKPTELSIKFRINGNLQEYTIAPESVKTSITTRIKILSGMNITDSLRPQMGSINFETQGRHNNMRVSSLPICDGEKIVVHISNYENNLKSISKMGLSPNDVEKIKRLIKNNQGLILITGTNSSGKTTTMYSMLKEINSKAINIISIEQPIKMKLEGINQVEIAPDKGLSYKNALKYAMLQDPNIICIDNLIDDEIAREAIRTAITGRLVISSLYTKNAYTTIDTLLNMDIENYLLGSNITGIISQRLAKQLCPRCKEKRNATEYEKNVIKKITNKDVTELYYPKGCVECHNGYISQIPIVEVIEIDDEIRSAITNKKDRNTIRKLLYKDNNTIIMDGFNKVIDGETSFNEIIRITDVIADFPKEQQDIKEYILGNGGTSTIQVLNDTQKNDKEELSEEIIEKPPIEQVNTEKEQEDNNKSLDLLKESVGIAEEELNEEIIEEPTEQVNTEKEQEDNNKSLDILKEITGIVEKDLRQFIQNEESKENLSQQIETNEKAEVIIPTPIEVSEISNNISNDDEDNDDEDDFVYSKDYENTF